jgi:hypothetical protein
VSGLAGNSGWGDNLGWRDGVRLGVVGGDRKGEGLENKDGIEGKGYDVSYPLRVVASCELRPCMDLGGFSAWVGHSWGNE